MARSMPSFLSLNKHFCFPSFIMEHIWSWYNLTLNALHHNVKLHDNCAHKYYTCGPCHVVWNLKFQMKGTMFSTYTQKLILENCNCTSLMHNKKKKGHCIFKFFAPSSYETWTPLYQHLVIQYVFTKCSNKDYADIISEELNAMKTDQRISINVIMTDGTTNVYIIMNTLFLLTGQKRG